MRVLLAPMQGVLDPPNDLYKTLLISKFKGFKVELYHVNISYD